MQRLSIKGFAPPKLVGHLSQVEKNDCERLWLTMAKQSNICKHNTWKNAVASSWSSKTCAPGLPANKIYNCQCGKLYDGIHALRPKLVEICWNHPFYDCFHLPNLRVWHSLTLKSCQKALNVRSCSVATDFVEDCLEVQVPSGRGNDLHVAHGCTMSREQIYHSRAKRIPENPIYLAKNSAF